MLAMPCHAVGHLATTKWRIMTVDRTPDPDYEARVRASFDAQAMMATLGARLINVEPGLVEIGFAHDDRFTQQHGFVHAGVMATILDSACGYAAFSLMPPDADVLTVEYKVNLLRPARSERYRVVGHVVRAGRTLTVSQATATAAGGREPIAVMTGTLMALTRPNGGR